MYYDLTIKRYGTEIPVTDQFKFLEVLFDEKLAFIAHLK